MICQQRMYVRDLFVYSRSIRQLRWRPNWRISQILSGTSDHNCRLIIVPKTQLRLYDWGQYYEKMLYDNAQLALAYLHGYLVTRDVKYRWVCEENLDFLLREMTHPEGGFYSSLDADSQGEEGKFYVWTQDEIETVLGTDFDFFKAAYAISPQGNW